MLLKGLIFIFCFLFIEVISGINGEKVVIFV